MVAKTWDELLQEEVKTLQRHDTDDLWEFASGILWLTEAEWPAGVRRFGDIVIRREAAPDGSYPAHELMLRGPEASVRVVLQVGSGRTIDRLELSDLERLTTDRNEESTLSRHVYDLFDDLWRHLGGQEIENPPTIALAVK